MKTFMQRTGAAITAVLGSLVMLTLASRAISTPYASGIHRDGLNFSFVLNEDADNVDIVYDGGATIVHMGRLTPGIHTFNATLGTTWHIVVTKSTPVGWVQISDDNLTQNKYYLPQGVTVDMNPKRSTFGQIIVAEGLGGAVGAGGRTTTDGLYLMSADQADVTAQGDTAHAGGVDWTIGGSISPFKVSMNRADPMGYDYTIYISDWSEGHSGIWTADLLNPTAAFSALLDNTGRDATGLVLEDGGVGPGELHGSVPAGPWVEGTGVNRVMYTVDEDVRRGNVLQYNIGTTNIGYTTAPTDRVTNGSAHIINYLMDVVRDEDGSWWIAQYRYDGDAAPSLTHWADGSSAPSWTSGPSTVVLDQAYGNLDIHNGEDLLVMGTSGGLIYVLDISDPDNPVLADTIAHSGLSVRDVAFDAAGNLYAVSSSTETLRIYSPGGYSSATTGSDGSFFVVREPSVASIVLNTNDSGPGSLRQVVAEARSGDTVTFTNTLSGQTILLTSGQILVTNNLTIDASDLANGIAIDGNASSRIFEFAAGTTNTLGGLTLTNGRASGNSPDHDGGAIFVNSGGQLTIADSTLSGNSATNGGGIFNNSSRLMFNRSTLSGNTAVSGGGIANVGVLTIDNSTLASNYGYYDGGGILNAGSLLLNNSTLSGNSTTNVGGGIFNATDGAMVLNNSTLSGNSATQWGGAIYNYIDGAIVLNNCTLCDNSAPAGCAINNNYGGTLTLTNSIVTWNFDGLGLDVICGPFTGTSNLVSNYPQGPRLAPLGYYGGPTQTMPPLPGSLAIDAGHNAVTNSLATDQRGYPRLVGSVVDIGAVEFQGAADATLAVSPTSLSPECTQGEDAISGSFEVWNSGRAALGYTISESIDWLSCTPTSGMSTGDTNLITVTYDTAGLAPGIYTGTITVTAEGAAGSPQTVAVTLKVRVPPALSLELIAEPFVGGTITAEPISVNGGYSNGTVITLTALPASGYQFAGWSGDAAGPANPTTVTMSAPRSVTALFRGPAFNPFDALPSAGSWITWPTWGLQFPIVWDPAVDRSGSPASGSLGYTVPFTGAADDQLMSFGTFANRFPWDDGIVLDGTRYARFSFDLKVAPGTAPTDAGDYGDFELGLLQGGLAQWELIPLPGFTLPATHDWVHVGSRIDPAAPGLDAIVGMYIKLWSGGKFTNTFSFNVDNLLLEPIPSPSRYGTALLAYDPLAYYRLDETAGATVFDYVGGHDGTLEDGAVLGVPGPRDPPFIGFESGNTALQTTSASNSWASAPFGSLATNTVTFTAWIYPMGNQTPYAGILMTRGGGIEGGMGYNDQQMLSYTWNNNTTWSYISGLVIPADQWSFVAMVIEPTQATLHLCNAHGQLSATHVLTHTPDVFGNNWLIGMDFADPSRTFNGVIDEVAVFAHALTPAQIQQLYTGGISGPPVRLSIEGFGPELRLVWTSGTLQQADGVLGPYADLPGAVSPCLVTPTEDHKFYRLQGPNLAQNPGFEAGTSGWSLLSATLTCSTDLFHSGTHSGLVANRTETWSGVGQLVAGVMDPSHTYRISAWARLASGPAQTIRLTMKKTDTSGTTYENVGAATVTSDAWTRLTGSYTLTVSGALTELLLYLEGPPAGIDFYADDAVIEP